MDAAQMAYAQHQQQWWMYQQQIYGAQHFHGVSSAQYQAPNSIASSAFGHMRAAQHSTPPVPPPQVPASSEVMHMGPSPPQPQPPSSSSVQGLSQDAVAATTGGSGDVVSSESSTCPTSGSGRPPKTRWGTAASAPSSSADCDSTASGPYGSLNRFSGGVNSLTMGSHGGGAGGGAAALNGRYGSLMGASTSRVGGVGFMANGGSNSLMGHGGNGWMGSTSSSGDGGDDGGGYSRSQWVVGGLAKYKRRADEAFGATTQTQDQSYGGITKRQANNMEYAAQRRALRQGLSTPLSTDNKGLKLLRMMGYKDGKALGKSGDGSMDPVVLDLYQQRQGLGYLEEKREKGRAKEEAQAGRSSGGGGGPGIYGPASTSTAPSSTPSSLSIYGPASATGSTSGASMGVYGPASSGGGGGAGQAVAVNSTSAAAHPNAGTAVVGQWQETIKARLLELFHPTPDTFQLPQGFKATLVTDERQSLQYDLPMLLNRYVPLYTALHASSPQVATTKLERNYVSSKCRRAVIIRDVSDRGSGGMGRPVGLIVVMLEPARKFRLQIPILHVEEPYRLRGFDAAALYLLSKLVLGGGGSNGIWLSMAFNEQLNQSALQRWVEFGGEIERTDKGPCVVFSQQMLQVWHARYRPM